MLCVREWFVERRRGRGKLPVIEVACTHFIIRWCVVKPIVKSEDMKWKKRSERYRRTDRWTDGRTRRDRVRAAEESQKNTRETGSLRVSASRAVQVGGHGGRVGGEKKSRRWYYVTK